MKKFINSIALTVFISACQSSADQQTKDSTSLPSKAKVEVTVAYNGTIHTVEESAPIVEAFAYQNKKIIAVGKSQELLTRYPKAETLDLNRATVIPGFIDAHGHLLGLGESLGNADLMGTKSKSEIIARLQEHAKSLAPTQWLLGRGWDQNDWPAKNLPSAADLDQAFPDRPVWLERVDGHANWANSKALEVATRDLNGTWQPEGGEIVRINAKASGVLIDNAVNLIQSKVPTTSEGQRLASLKRAMQKTASVGLTAMHDAGTTLETWHLLQQLNQQEALDVRVYAMANGAKEMLSHLCDNGASIDPNAMLTARSVKLYSDGALGSRGAALLADYSDEAGNVGLLIESETTLKQHAKRAVGCGLQVNIHAIGDRGNRVTLNVLEQASSGTNPGRHRIEHSQVIQADDFQRFKDLKLIASVQPTHATSDMYWAEDRVGAKRITGAYAWQKFIKLGVPIALGSDFPVEQPDPLHGFYAAVSRQDAQGWPADGWYPDESLSREQALYGFTKGAAFAAFQEQQLGSISVGKYADFVVLSQDIMQVPISQILETQIVATYINGKAVYQASK